MYPTQLHRISQVRVYSKERFDGRRSNRPRLGGRERESECLGEVLEVVQRCEEDLGHGRVGREVFHVFGV